MRWMSAMELVPEADGIFSFYRLLLFVPCLCAVISAALVLPHSTSLAWFRHAFARPHLRPRLENDVRSRPVPSLNTNSPSHLARSHNWRYAQNSIFYWNLSRLLSCIALVALTIAIATLEHVKHRTTGAEHPHRDTNFNPENNDIYSLPVECGLNLVYACSLPMQHSSRR
ncbi:hypothetical protein B0J17DRAFT_339262 [Rhizoctonia solani]|nr:hypothetical protein B0J17DRAFT_339262 [Rhizoctonia solani]